VTAKAPELTTARQVAASGDWSFGGTWPYAPYVWGMRDRALGEGALRRWQERLPGEAIELDDSASFVPEDAPEESLAAVLDCARRTP
jgi:pimeloyl-ACP methyl ester carboxylesterase